MHNILVGLLMLYIHLRWLYFHINPMYLKFYISKDEAHFQHKKNGTIHSNIIYKKN